MDRLGCSTNGLAGLLDWTDLDAGLVDLLGLWTDGLAGVLD
jgi:hypothetical protein